MSLFVVHVDAGGHGRILKDGVDISNEVVGFSITARVGESTRVELLYGATVVVPLDLLESLVDDEDCWFDHHGGCQAHGYLSLEPGEVCPQRQLKDIIIPTPSSSASPASSGWWVPPAPPSGDERPGQ